MEQTGATPTASDILDAALSEDSLGLTPTKQPLADQDEEETETVGSGRRERAASGPRSRRDLMPRRAVLRSASGSRKSRAPARAASPAILKQLRSMQAAQTPPDGSSVETRLAALEANAAEGNQYMREMCPAIQALQAVVGHHETRLEELNEATNRQAMEQAELIKQTRRELFAVRDLLGEKMQNTENTLNAGTVAVVEAKFAQLEGFIGQLQGHLVGLTERGAVVEGVVAQDEATVENAFAFVDAKINQVGEIVKRFETVGAPSVTGVTSPFTVKMRDSMQHMHTKLSNIDGEVLLAIQEQTVPMCEQLVSLQQQASAQFEQINILTTAMTAPYPTSVDACGTCNGGSPWTADATAAYAAAAGPYQRTPPLGVASEAMEVLRAAATQPPAQWQESSVATACAVASTSKN